MEDRRDLDPAPPARRTATAAAAPSEPGLGGPGTSRDPTRRDTERPSARAAAAGHPRTESCAGTVTSFAAAGPPGPCAARPAGSPPAGTSPEHQGPDPPAGPRKLRPGLPQDLRGTGRPSGTSLGTRDMGDPEEGRHRSRAAAERASLAAVPAFSGRCDPGL